MTADLVKKLKKVQLPELEEEKLRIFQFNDQLADYEELVVEADIPLYELLDPDFILLFVDPEHYRVWLWHGANTTTRMKFIAAKVAPKIRDQYGIAYKITAVDEGQETRAFKVTSGIEKEKDYEKEQTGPTYEGTKEDMELLAELSREKIVLLLEKSGIPEGYERKMVIVKNKIYGYKEFDQNYMGSVIKEKRLFPLLWKGGEFGYYFTLPKRATHWREVANPNHIPTDDTLLFHDDTNILSYS